MAQQATHNDPKKTKRVKQLLGKRVDVAKGEKLGRDVKTPKWLKAIADYFSGSWHELRQVRWPTRRASISLTFAVLVFTFAIAGFILALDQLFELLFRRVIL